MAIHMKQTLVQSSISSLSTHTVWDEDVQKCGQYKKNMDVVSWKNSQCQICRSKEHKTMMRVSIKVFFIILHGIA